MAEPIWLAIGLASLAGLSIPCGAWLAVCRVDFLSNWAETELRHGVIAFGAGALLAAVALVLIPEGTERLDPLPALFWFFLGGLVFAWIDRALATRGGKTAQFLAMLMDYIPEALALGALLAGDLSTAVLVALLICLQNLPESFNAMREMADGGHQPTLWLFAAMVPIGPLAAIIGLTLPAAFAPGIGAVMMVSAGGIMYLMFQDIAPEVPLENAALPPFGAVLGFGVGLAGDLFI